MNMEPKNQEIHRVQCRNGDITYPLTQLAALVVRLWVFYPYHSEKIGILREQQPHVFLIRVTVFQYESNIHEDRS
ncbi:hypothetical protein ANAPC1_00644 [Anaplasma phagocytophilum]|uniref:Uncharacterized protein n=1 Tax=Anaplasma phagocytophilum TaxID=948 RepID=A0AA45UT21_ANAPH|nr:hypothetical protein ANAPC1_00644 [Anaplasma phagocytophilum]